MSAIQEIKGHPSVEAHRAGQAPNRITLCAECESMRTILFLDGDRWFCTKCKNSGRKRGAQISLYNPKVN